MKKSIKILIWILSGIVLVLIIGFVSIKQRDAVCTKISINISDSADLKIIDNDFILSILESGNQKLIDKPIKEINISKLERKINNSNFVKHADVYMKINGELVVDVQARVPIVRICNRLNQHFQIDKDGYIMPVSAKNPIRIVVANGNISHKPKLDTIFNIYDHKYDKRIDIKTLRDIHILARYIYSKPFWEAQIQQIYINNTDEIELSVLVGNQRIIFGDIQNYEDKLRNLEAFYKKAMPIEGLNKYREINLKFKNQVVCVKNE